MDPVVHFEIPTENKKRIISFYSKVFGWKSVNMGSAMKGYVNVTTTKSDPKTAIPLTPGKINGGIYLKTKDPYSYHLSIVISVNDLEKSIEKVKAAGGRIHGEITNIPKVGKFVSFIDTEGNHLSMLQPVSAKIG